MELKRPISEADWAKKPQVEKDYIVGLENTVIQLVATVEKLTKRVEELENRLNKNSSNSNKPPSSDSPFKKKSKTTKGKRKGKDKKLNRGGQPGHPGHKQELLDPTDEKLIYPGKCSCGCSDLLMKSIEKYYTHQHIETPRTCLNISHFILYKGTCKNCGNIVNAEIPNEYKYGYGPRLSTLIGELSGSYGTSRMMVQDFCQSYLDLHISTGAIQKVIDRVSAALEPVYNQIGKIARISDVNFIDETSWRKCHDLHWLWVMVNKQVAFFKIHKNRSKEAFLELIDDWKGILVSDNYGTYVKWVHGRQACLAHLTRKAIELSERKDPIVSQFGESIARLLKKLTHYSKEPPSEKEWEDFFIEFMLLTLSFEDTKNEAGKFARKLGREIETLWLFLDEKDVEPTNNIAERAIRFAVLWRKRSKGTQSDKGNRWVERILSVKKTSQIKSCSLFEITLDAVHAYFHSKSPNLSWLT